MPRCPFCDQNNPPGATDCLQCRATLPYAPGMDQASAQSSESSDAETLDAALRSLLSRGDKIAAIKLYRTRTGAGLREAKDAVEAFARQNGLPVRRPSSSNLASLLCLLIILAAAAVFLAG